MKKKELVRIGDNLGPADLQVKLTKAQSRTRQAMLDAISDGGLTPPLAKELVQSLDQKPAEIDQLLNLTAEDGLIVKVGDGLFMTPESLDLAREKCKETLAGIQAEGESEGATMAQLRDGWGVTRKYAVPLCEYLDSIGVTIRLEDIRIVGPEIDTVLGVSG